MAHAHKHKLNHLQLTPSQQVSALENFRCQLRSKESFCLQNTSLLLVSQKDYPAWITALYSQGKNQLTNGLYGHVSENQGDQIGRFFTI